MKAYLKNYRQSPRKVRLVGDFVKGKNVREAVTLLTFLPKRASEVMRKLIASAMANAEHNYRVSGDDLFIKNVHVDQGITLKRFRARARGRASRINKRTSNIMLVLEQRSPVEEATKKDARPAKKVEKEAPKKTQEKETATA